MNLGAPGKASQGPGPGPLLGRCTEAPLGQERNGTEAGSCRAQQPQGGVQAPTVLPSTVNPSKQAGWTLLRVLGSPSPEPVPGKAHTKWEMMFFHWANPPSSSEGPVPPVAAMPQATSTCNTPLSASPTQGTLEPQQTATDWCLSNAAPPNSPACYRG